MESLLDGGDLDELLSVTSLDDVADAAKMHRAIFQRDIGITHPDRPWFGILRAVRPEQLPLRDPLAGPVPKRPFRMGITDVLKEDEFTAGSVSSKAAVGVFGEIGFAFPNRKESLERGLGIASGEFQNLRPSGGGIDIVGGEGRVGRKEQVAVGKAGQR